VVVVVVARAKASGAEAYQLANVSFFYPYMLSTRQFVLWNFHRFLQQMQPGRAIIKMLFPVRDHYSYSELPGTTKKLMPILKPFETHS